MKNKRFWAALLCMAMIFTSQSFNVSAAMQDGLLTDESTVMAVEADEISEPLADTDEVPAEGLAEEGLALEESLVDEGALIDEAISDVDTLSEGLELFAEEGISETLLTEGEAAPEQPEGAGPSACFKKTRYLELADGVTDLSEYAQVVIPKEVEIISANIALFVNNKKTTKVTFEGNSSLTTIEAGAFENSAITAFVSPDGYTTISANTFKGCSDLTQFTFNKVSKIGDSAFEGCIKLNTGIAGGEYVTSIGQYAFKGAGFKEISTGTDANFKMFTQPSIMVGVNAFEACPFLTKASLPKGFATIPQYCFKGCSELKSVTIGNNTRKIEENAFYGCSKLDTINFGSIETVSDNAFTNCSSIKELDFPESMTTVGAYAFAGCTNIVKVTFRYKNSEGIADEATLHIAGTAFAAPKKITYWGYGGAVKKYADTYGSPNSYKPLLIKHYITINSLLKANNGAVSFVSGVSKNGVNYEAVNGQTVKVRVTPGTDYTLVHGSLEDTKGPDTAFDYVSGSMESQVYSFVMPNRDVDIKGSYVAKSKLNKSTTNYSYEIGRYNDTFGYEKDGEKNWKTDKSGNKGVLRITANVKDDASYLLGPWMYTYESKSNVKDTTVASIDSKGLITALAQGSTVITATPADNSTAKKVEFTLTVGQTVQINDIYFDTNAAEFPSPLYGVGRQGAARVFDKNDPARIQAHLPYEIIYNKSDLNSSDQTFKLKLKLKDKDNEFVFGKVTWSSANESVATLKNKSNYDNSNEITIKKGSEGEVLIKATATGYQKDENTKKYEVLNAYAILRIIDTNPRVTTTEVRVNKQRDAEDIYRGTQISIIPAENQRFAGDAYKGVGAGGTISEYLYWYNKDKNLENYTGLKIMLDESVANNPDANGRYYYRIYSTGEDAAINALKEGQTKSFSGNSKLYIHGKYDKNSSTDFYIPIQKLVVYNEILKPTISMTGDINLFYNSLCYDPATNIDARAWKEVMGDDADKNKIDDQITFIKKTINYITVTQSIPEITAAVDYTRSQLVTADNYRKYILNKKDTDFDRLNDPFKKNFETFPDFESDNNFIIMRTANDLEKKSNKEITSGYLFIYYYGYSKPSPVKINLKVKNAKPSYVLSETKVKANNNNTGSTFKFKVLTKDKKDTAVINSDLYLGAIPNPGTQGLNVVASKSTPNVFADLTNASMDNNGVITLKVSNTLPTGNSKAVISVQKKHWYRTIEYTYNISTSGVSPKAKMLKSKVYLNSNMKCNNGDKGSANVTMALDQSDCTAGIKSIENLGGVSNITTQFAADPDFPNKVNINFAIKDTVQKGTYKFKIIPTASYSGGTPSDLKEVYVSVVVSDKNPGLSLARTSYVFNVDYPDKEIYTTRIKSYKNIPSGIIGQNPDLDALKAMDIDKSGITVKYAGNAKNQVKGDAIANALKADISDIKYDKKTRKYYYNVTLKLRAKVVSEAFSLPFTIEGVKINGAAIAPCKITIKGKSVEPKVKLRASGKINTADPTTFISYKFSMKDLMDPEVGDTAKVYEDGKESTQFTLTLDQDHKTSDDMRWQLKAISNPNDGTVEVDEKGYDKNFRSGKHVLIFEFTVAGKKFQTGKVNVTPKQSLSKLKAKPNKTSFYAGAALDHRITSVELYKTSELKTLISDVKLSNSNSAAVKSAFVVKNYINDNQGNWRDFVRKKQRTLKAGDVEIQCVNPSVLKAGKTYTLILETQTAGQFYKWDADKKIVKDAKGKNVVTTGSTVKINVVVYN